MAVTDPDQPDPAMYGGAHASGRDDGADCEQNRRDVVHAAKVPLSRPLSPALRLRRPVREELITMAHTNEQPDVEPISALEPTAVRGAAEADADKKLPDSDTDTEQAEDAAKPAKRTGGK